MTCDSRHEGPADKMITAYPKEFAFMRHETKRSLRNKKLNDYQNSDKL